MRIVVAGASGLIGKRVVSYFREKGHEVWEFTRRTPRGFRQLLWDPTHQQIEAEKLEGADILLNFSGDPIASGRWTKAKKEQILNSRVETTQLLASSMAKLRRPPPLWINASAIGYYGNRGNEVLTEESGPGTGFLSEVCQEWEKSTVEAQKRGIRTVFLRTGMVLAEEGGALAKMLPLFRWGLGGPIGSGRQWMSWIALDEIPSVLSHIIGHQEIAGAVNLVSKEPVINQVFTQALGRVLNRPAILPVPAFALKLALGEMAEELLLASTRVEPSILERTGYHFRFSDLQQTLSVLCGKFL